MSVAATDVAPVTVAPEPAALSPARCEPRLPMTQGTTVRHGETPAA